MSTKFKNNLGHIDFIALNVFRQSPAADNIRANMVLAGNKIKAPRIAQVNDKQMGLHRLKCGQSIIIDYVDTYDYKDAVRFRVRYYNKLSHCFYAVIKHKNHGIFEIARLF